MPPPHTRPCSLAGSSSGTVYALNATSGALRWRWIGTGGNVTKAGIIFSAATNLVFAGLSGYNGNLGFAYALDAATGALVWTQQLLNPRADVTPVLGLNETIIYFGSNSASDPTGAVWGPSAFTAMNTTRASLANNKRNLWSVKTLPTSGPPAYFGILMPKLVLSADGTRVYATSRSNTTSRTFSSMVLAFSAANNSLLWYTASAANVPLLLNSPSLLDGAGINPASELLVAASETVQLGGCCSPEFARLSVRAYSARSGAMVWEQTQDTYAFNTLDLYDVSPIIVGPPGSAVAYVPSRYGYTFTINMADGSYAWRVNQSLGWDGSSGEFKHLGVTAPLVITPSGAVITANEIPKNQIRIWGNASFPSLVDPARSTVSCGALAPLAVVDVSGASAVGAPNPLAGFSIVGLAIGLSTAVLVVLIVIGAVLSCMHYLCPRKEQPR